MGSGPAAVCEVAPDSRAPHRREPRSARRLLGDRDLGSLFCAKVASMVGTWAFTMSAAIAVYQQTSSALAVGLVGTSIYLPQLALAAAIGSRADRGHLRHLVLVGAVAMALGSAVATLLVGLLPMSGWAFAGVVMACSACIGTGIAVSNPAMQALVPRLVTREELPAAMGINFAPMTVARILGPVAGAGLLAHGGVALGFGFTAVCQTVALVALSIVREPQRVGEGPGKDYSMRAAVRLVVGDTRLLLIFAVAAAITVGTEPSLTLAAPLARELHVGEALVGALSAAFGVGALAGLVADRAWRSGAGAAHAVQIALGVMALGLGCGAVGPSVVPVLLGSALTGAGYSVALSRTATDVVLRVPDALRGRVLALWMLCFVGVRPLSSALLGLLADLVSTRVAIGALALAMVGVAWLCRGHRDELAHSRLRTRANPRLSGREGVKVSVQSTC